MTAPELQTRTASALDRIRKILGPEHVRVSTDEIEARSRCTIPWQRTCSAVVYPGSAADVLSIVRVAGNFGVPLWVFSRGKNWGYGTTMALQDGAIVLILERMNRILEVNEDLAYAVIEPGVTYRQLNDYLKERNIKLWIDCTDGPPEGSVVGNALERGIGETSYGDHFANICGMEVVLPNGDTVRTGGGPPHWKAWHVHKWGVGPYLEGLFSQSNLGIVTKAGIWLMPQPESFRSFVFEMRTDDNLPQVIDALRGLALSGAIQSKVHIINDFVALALVTRYPHELANGGSSIPDDAKAWLRRRYKVAPWTFGGGLYGSREQVRTNMTLIERGLARHGRLMFLSDRTDRHVRRWLRVAAAIERRWESRIGYSILRAFVGKPVQLIEALPHTHAILQGVPTEYFVSHAYFKHSADRPRADIDPARDGCGLMWAGFAVPSTGRHVDEVLRICLPVYRKHDLDAAVALLLANPRSLIALMSIFYDKGNPNETARALALYNEMCAAMLTAGYQQYRTSVGYMDRLWADSPEYQRLADAIKTALDPCGVLAPGRYGMGRHWLQGTHDRVGS